LYTFPSFFTLRRTILYNDPHKIEQLSEERFVPKKEKGMNQMPNKMKKKPHSPEFKFKVAIDAIRGDKTTAELSQEYSVVSSQIFKWKKALLEQGAEVFKNGTPTQSTESAQIEKLHAKIGRLTIENDFLEKVLGKSR